MIVERNQGTRPNPLNLELEGKPTPTIFLALTSWLSTGREPYDTSQPHYTYEKTYQWTGQRNELPEEISQTAQVLGLGSDGDKIRLGIKAEVQLLDPNLHSKNKITVVFCGKRALIFEYDNTARSVRSPYHAVVLDDLSLRWDRDFRLQAKRIRSTGLFNDTVGVFSNLCRWLNQAPLEEMW